MGAPETTLRAALGALRSEGLVPRRVSRFFRTPCFPEGIGPDYVNAAVALSPLASDLEPKDVLDRLHAIEARFGRVRGTRWGGRTLDLDLLAVNDNVSPGLAFQEKWRHLPLDDQMRDAPGQLILPHPRLQDRAFVLIPLMDIAPSWRHPATGATVADMVAALPERVRAEVVPL